MASYRLKFLVAFSGKATLSRDFEAETDAAAIAYADDARGMTAMELWNEERKVKRWEAFPPAH